MYRADSFFSCKVAGSKSTSSAVSKFVTIPVQSDRSSKSIPIQKISSRSSNSSASSEDQDLHRTADLAAIEETYRSRTKALEEELGGLREQLTCIQKDSEAQAVKSQKTFTELKANFDKELNSWNKERELFKKNGKLVIMQMFNTNCVLCACGYVFILVCLLHKIRFNPLNRPLFTSCSRSNHYAQSTPELRQ